MIINSSICRLANSTITLPSAITGPILGGDKITLYSLLEQPREQAKYVEILTTSVNPKCWADLWRIEVETYDRIGTTLSLLQYVSKKGIEIVASEAATNSFGLRHTISFVANCAGYNDSVDGDHNSRCRNPRALMQRLSEGIGLHFFDQLTLGDSGYLRVKVKRMSTLYALHNARSTSQLSLMVASTGRAATRGKIELPSGYLVELNQKIASDLWYSPSVDTKNRVVRTLVFALSDSGIRHFQIKMDKSSSINLARLFELIASHQANVVKHTIYPIYDRYSQTPSAVGLDIALEWKTTSGNGRLKKLLERILRDRKLKGAGVSIVKSDGEQDEQVEKGLR